MYTYDPELPRPPLLPVLPLPPRPPPLPPPPPRPPPPPPPLRFHRSSVDDSSRSVFCSGWCVASSAEGGATTVPTATSVNSVAAKRKDDNFMMCGLLKGKS